MNTITTKDWEKLNAAIAIALASTDSSTDVGGRHPDWHSEAKEAQKVLINIFPYIKE